MFVNKIENKIQRYLSDEKTGEYLFLVAFIIFLTGETLTTTMFSIPGKVYLLCKMVAVMLIGIKVLCFDIYRRRTFGIFIFLMAAAVVIMVHTGYTEPFMWLLMLFGARNVPWKKILQTYLVVSAAIVLLAFCASLLNIIENLQYIRAGEDIVRNSFGIVYTTDFASHIFSLMLVSFYLLRERLTMLHYGIAATVAGLVFWFCHTRLDVACMLILILLFMILGMRKPDRSLKSRYRETGGIGKLCVWIMPIAALGMFVSTKLYREGNAAFEMLDQILSLRLSLGQEGLMRYDITPFGQMVRMIGYGGGNEWTGEYFFVDCSYLYVLLRYGIIFLLFVLAVYVKCCKKFRKDHYFLVAIALVSLNCMIAHHLIELAYNPFALALFAAVPDIAQNESLALKCQYNRFGVKNGGNESKISKI